MRAVVGAATVACALVLGCLDAAGPGGGRHVSLNIVPVFEGMSPLATPTDVDSFFIRVSNPPDPDVTVGVRIPAGQDSITLRVDVALNSSRDTITVGFQGFNSATGLLLYQGSQTVELTAGVPLPSTPVPASYVGPGGGIQVLSVTPRTAALRPQQTVQLAYTALDTAGITMSNDSVPVRYATSNASVALVSSAGLVTAQGSGTARIFVTALANSLIEDTSVVDVSTAPPPLIGLSVTAVAFADSVGTSDPAPKTVNVNNTGGGTLSGLAVGTITYGPGATNWLTATLNSTTAPATLTLSPSNAGLSAGTYTATVPVSAAGAGNSPQNVTVTYSLSPAPLVIALSPTSVTITDTLATANPAPRTVAVTNAGVGTLSGLAVGTVAYGPGATGWLAATISPTTTPATLSLSASLSGLVPGSYTATVPVTAPGASNSPQTVSVTFNVVAALPVSLALTPGFGVVRPGNTLSLAVSARDALGNPTTTTGTAYTSRAPGVATVNAVSGVVTGVAAGGAVIVAQLQGVSDSIVVAVPATGSAVVSAIGDARAYDVRLVGDTVRVLVQVDLSAVQPEKLGSYNAQLDWAPATLRYVRADPVTGGLAGLTVNATNVTTGQLRFGAADAAGSPTAVTGLVQVVFVAQATGTSTMLLLNLTDLSAAGTFRQMLPQALIVDGIVKVQ